MLHSYTQFLGYAVRNARMKKGWTQMETAERTGVNIKTIQNIEKLDGNPCLIHLAEIVRVLEINPITLFYPEMGEENAVRDELQILLSQCDANELDLLLRISKAVLSGNTSGKPAQTE